MNNKITYHREGDYFIPDLYLPKQPKGHIGKYGRLRLNYLKNFDRGLYTELLIDGTLKQYLLDIDENANNKVNLLIKQLNVLDDNFLDYFGYWNEKYYRNGFCDAVELISGCLR